MKKRLPRPNNIVWEMEILSYGSGIMPTWLCQILMLVTLLAHLQIDLLYQYSSLKNALIYTYKLNILEPVTTIIGKRRFVNGDQEPIFSDS